MTPEDVLKKHAIDFQNWISRNNYWESATDKRVWGRNSNIEQFWSLDSVYEMFITGNEIPPTNTKQVIKYLKSKL